MVDTLVPTIFLYSFKFIVFKFESVSHINTEREQSKSYFGDHSGSIVFYVGIIATNINDCAKHTITP